MNQQGSLAKSLALAAALGLGASLIAVPAAAEEARTHQMNWGQCPDDVVAEAAPTVLQCATVRVPLDYTHPEGEQIDLAVSRLAAANPDRRRGVLMLNPGGPGGSGLALSALLVAQGLPSSVTDRYDLIGMDTRGIGHSTPVSCGFTTDSSYYSNIPPYAVDDAAVTAQAKVAEQAAKQCADNDDGRLRHFTTANTARDLDRIRDALGEEKTSYLGYSYGTALGATYASMFPERSDRVVLDSNIGDTHLDRDGMRRYALGMEQTFPDFANWPPAATTATAWAAPPPRFGPPTSPSPAHSTRTPSQGSTATSSGSLHSATSSSRRSTPPWRRSGRRCAKATLPRPAA
uniref:alpha/beta fold hydrolase n=1 Tax=Streptomyces sp. NRRL B-24051 TaxID=1463832 RepID=UPI000AB9E346|nr:alpha/beta fold hydrolase [Streptomyces sp. NRRL B-24051]